LYVRKSCPVGHPLDPLPIQLSTYLKRQYGQAVLFQSFEKTAVTKVSTMDLGRDRVSDEVEDLSINMAINVATQAHFSCREEATRDH